MAIDIPSDKLEDWWESIEMLTKNRIQSAVSTFDNELTRWLAKDDSIRGTAKKKKYVELSTRASDLKSWKEYNYLIVEQVSQFAQALAVVVKSAFTDPLGWSRNKVTQTIEQAITRATEHHGSVGRIAFEIIAKIVSLRNMSANEGSKEGETSSQSRSRSRRADKSESHKRDVRSKRDNSGSSDDRSRSRDGRSRSRSWEKFGEFCRRKDDRHHSPSGRIRSRIQFNRTRHKQRFMSGKGEKPSHSEEFRSKNSREMRDGRSYSDQHRQVPEHHGDHSAEHRKVSNTQHDDGGWERSQRRAPSEAYAESYRSRDGGVGAGAGTYRAHRDDEKYVRGGGIDRPLDRRSGGNGVAGGDRAISPPRHTFPVPIPSRSIVGELHDLTLRKFSVAVDETIALDRKQQADMLAALDTDLRQIFDSAIQDALGGREEIPDWESLQRVKKLLTSSVNAAMDRDEYKLHWAVCSLWPFRDDFVTDSDYANLPEPPERVPVSLGLHPSYHMDERHPINYNSVDRRPLNHSSMERDQASSASISGMPQAPPPPRIS